MAKKFLEGCQKLTDGRYRIRENFVLTNKDYKKLPLNESKLVESVDGKKYKCRSAYEMKVWELDKYNLNDRLYSSELANHVIKEGRSTIGFMNHPSGNDGNMKDVCAVEKNPRIKDGWLCIETYLVTQDGEDINEILEAGGPIGISSSCLGSLDEEGRVCLDENFELERYGDIVDQPSNNYMHTIENDIKLESKEKTNLSIEEDTKKTKVESMGNKKISQLEENIFIDFVERKIKEINNLDATTRVSSFLGLLESFDDETVKTYDNVLKFKEEITTKLKEAREEVDVLIEKGKESDNLKETKVQIVEKYNELVKNFKELKENYIKSCNLAEQSKSFYKKFKSLFEIEQAKVNGMIDIDSYLETVKYSEDLEQESKDIKVKFNGLLKNFRESQKKLKVLKFNEQKKAKQLDMLVKKRKQEQSKAYKKALIKKEHDDKINKLKLEALNKKKKEENIYIRNDRDLEEYYLELRASHPYLENQKERILSCKTLKEAYKMFLKIKNEYEEKDSRYYENTKIEEMSENLSFNFHNNMMDRILKTGLK